MTFRGKVRFENRYQPQIALKIAKNEIQNPTDTQLNTILDISEFVDSPYMLGKTKVKMGPITVPEPIRQIQNQI